LTTSFFSFLFVFLHEIVHIAQQAVISSRYSKYEISSYIMQKRDVLERDANLGAVFILGSGLWKVLISDIQSRKNNGSICFCGAQYAVAQFWMVDGSLSVLSAGEGWFSEIEDYYDYLKKMNINSPDLENMKEFVDLEASAKIQGIHETFTIDAIQQLLSDIRDDVNKEIKILTAYEEDELNKFLERIQKDIDEKEKSFTCLQNTIHDKASCDDDMHDLIQMEQELNFLKGQKSQVSKTKSNSKNVRICIEHGLYDKMLRINVAKYMNRKYLAMLYGEKYCIKVEQTNSLDKRTKIKKFDVRSAILGSSLNDRYTNGNVVFGLKYILRTDSFLNQSHHGYMQFLHSMDCSDGVRTLNLEKILRWIDFCVDVFNNIELQNNKEIQELTFVEYLKLLKKEDVFWAMIGQMLASPHSQFPKKFRRNITRTLKEDQIIFGQELIDYLEKNQHFLATEWICDGAICAEIKKEKKTMGAFYNMTIGEFFGNKDGFEPG